MFDLCRLRCKNTTLFYIVGDIFEKDEKKFHTPNPSPEFPIVLSPCSCLCFFSHFTFGYCSQICQPFSGKVILHFMIQKQHNLLSIHNEIAIKLHFVVYEQNFYYMWRCASIR